MPANSATPEVATRRREEPAPSVSRPSRRGAAKVTKRQAVILAAWAPIIGLEFFPATHNVAFGLAAAGCFAAIAFGVRLYKPSRRWPWWLILSSFVLFVVGGTARYQLSTLGNLTARRSLVPDLITIPGYALLAAGLIGFTLAKTTSALKRRFIIYDGVIASLAALAISWTYVIEPILRRHSAPVALRYTLVSYPAISLFLLVVTVQIAFGSGRVRGPADRFLIGAMVSLLVGDTIYMLAEIHVLNTSSIFLDLPYVIAFLSASTGVLDPSMRFLTEHGNLPWTRWTKTRLSLIAVALLVPPFLFLQSRTDGMSARIELFVIAFVLSATGIAQLIQAMRVVERSESQLMHQALHDDLTGFANRRSLERSLAHVLAKAESTESRVGVLFIDLDRFKLINDTIGHNHGDALLVQVANRLVNNVRPSDLVTRIGGDEFVIVLDGNVEMSKARELANSLRECIREPFIVEGTEFFVTASIGLVCSVPDSWVTPEQLIRNADTAMYQAKEAGRDTVAVFEDAMRVQLTERVEIERELRHAVSRNELHLVFQPIVTLGRPDVTGFEALVRWAHPRLGVVPPLRFIPVAEESDLIGEIGSWVLNDALRQVAIVRSTPGLENLTVAANLSAVQLRDELLVQRVGRALSAHDLPGSALVLEVTESEMMRDPELSIAALTEIRRLDVKIAIDDFGTEYSSLAYLQRLPVDILKIDRSFVIALDNDDSASESLIGAIVAMAKALSIRTVVEGVETVEQAQRVTALGCDSAQGYLYARPARSDQLLDVLGLLRRWQPSVQEEPAPVSPVTLPPRLEVVRWPSTGLPSA